jgi:hypothetical protein
MINTARTPVSRAGIESTAYRRSRSAFERAPCRGPGAACGRELDLLVIQLGGSVVTCDEPGAMEPPEVAEDERVSGLSLHGRAP